MARVESGSQLYHEWRMGDLTPSEKKDREVYEWIHTHFLFKYRLARLSLIPAGVAFIALSRRWESSSLILKILGVASLVFGVCIACMTKPTYTILDHIGKQLSEYERDFPDSVVGYEGRDHGKKSQTAFICISKMQKNEISAIGIDFCTGRDFHIGLIPKLKSKPWDLFPCWVGQRRDFSPIKTDEEGSPWTCPEPTRGIRPLQTYDIVYNGKVTAVTEPFINSVFQTLRAASQKS